MAPIQKPAPKPKGKNSGSTKPPKQLPIRVG